MPVEVKLRLETVKSNWIFGRGRLWIYGTEKYNAKTWGRVSQVCTTKNYFLLEQRGVGKRLCFTELSLTMYFWVPGLLLTFPSSSSNLRWDVKKGLERSVSGPSVPLTVVVASYGFPSALQLLLFRICKRWCLFLFSFIATFLVR